MLAHVRELIEPDGVAYVSTPNVLTLAPEGRGALRQPVARARVQAGRVPRAVRAPLRPGRPARPLPRPQAAARTRSRSSTSAWDRVHKGLRFTKPFYDRFTPAISVRDFTLPARRAGPQPGPAGRAAAMTRLSIVLHTHMPYVEGFGTWPFGEEWLWEAIATSYLPLLDVLDAHPGQGHALDHAGAGRPARGAGRARALPGVPARDPAGVARPRRRHGARTAPLEYSRARYAAAADALERRGDLIAAFAPHVTWTSAATHAVLPLLATDAGVRLQLETGIASHRERFGTWDGGFWLPECAHAPWLDELLEEAGVHMTCVDWTDVTRRPRAAAQRGRARSCSRSTAPRSTSCGTERGYPSHGDYRDSHRLTARAHAVWANDGTPYDPERGAARARADAQDFVARVAGRRGRRLRHRALRPPLARGRDVPGGGAASTADVVPLAAHDGRGRARTPRRRRWGAGRDLRTWDVELAWAQRSRRAGRARRGAVRRAPCASCSRCRARTGRS